MTFGEKCLAATQLLLRTQILGRFSLFARRDVLERHQNPAFGMARERQRTGVKNERPWTLSRKDEIRLNGLERMTAGKHLFELRTQQGQFKGAAPEIVEGDSLRLIARDPAH